MCWENPQDVPNTCSDTPELPDTLLNTVWDTFNDFSKSYNRLEWPCISWVSSLLPFLMLMAL